MNHLNKTLETNSLSSFLKGTSIFLAAIALVVGGFFVATGTAFATTQH